MRIVRVTDESTGDDVATRVRVASSLVDRTVGLLTTREVLPDTGLWIERSPSIHMFFMRYPIDAIFVDADGTVVKLVEHLRPWRIVPWARGARDCLELRAGTIAERGVRVGHRLRLVDAGEASEGG